MEGVLARTLVVVAGLLAGGAFASEEGAGPAFEVMDPALEDQVLGEEEPAPEEPGEPDVLELPLEPLEEPASAEPAPDEAEPEEAEPAEPAQARASRDPGPDPCPEAGPVWKRRALPHFDLCLESSFAPKGLTLELERLHSRMKLDLGALAPWMERERVRVFLFRSSATYLAGPFGAPAWSNGFSIVDRKLIAVYVSSDHEALSRVIAHEMTHVLFETYFAGAPEGGLRSPPAWLTEGLAMLLETPQTWTDEREKRSPWARKLEAGGLRAAPMRSFLASSPDDAKSTKGVDDWYLQAYAVARFLLREHSRLQFRTFCRRFRDGAALEASLSAAYAYRTIEDLERAWSTWLSRSGAPARFSPTPIRPTPIRKTFK